MNDPLDVLLTPSPSPADDPLRGPLLQRTQRLLRWRRRARLLAAATALAACYAAGLATVHLMPGHSPRRAEDVPPTVTTPREAEPVRVANAPEPSQGKSALDREWEAADSTEPAGQLYRQAGDQYLEEEGDPLAALRCYGNALDAGADPTPAAQDSYLLLAIKNARTKENRYAQRP
jgi:hypothetical protein